MKKFKGLGKWSLLLAVLLLHQSVSLQGASAAWEVFTDRPGGNLPGTPFPVHDKEAFVAVTECENACKNNSECRAYTYVKPGIQGPDGYCWLKNDVPAPIKNECCTSGVVRPKTDADRCNNYAATAIEQNQSNIVWECGHVGPQWSSTYKQHYDWCMTVPASTADAETAERHNLLSKCWTGPPSTSGDLSAFDWCYSIDKVSGTITFYPIIKNVGLNDWKSKKDGYYAIGAEVNSVLSERKYPLPPYPYWFLKRDETSKLEGIALPFHPNNQYRVINPWVLSHPEDVNQGNNSHAGLKGLYEGTEFEKNHELVIYDCQACPQITNIPIPNFSGTIITEKMKPVMGKKNVLVILWDPHRPSYPAPKKEDIEKILFAPSNSAKDWFLQNSWGKVDLVNAGVLGWYDAPQDKQGDHYWDNLNHQNKYNDGWLSGHVEKWADAVRRAAADFNFKAYDANKDGKVTRDELIILIIIPQKDSFGTALQHAVGKQFPVVEPLKVQGDLEIPEIVEWYSGIPVDWGTAVHELAHQILGTPDMYFTGPWPYAAAVYSNSDASWAGAVHISGPEKLKLGWLNYKVGIPSGNYSLKAVETSNEALILYNPKRGLDEYYLIENRWRGASYDAGDPHGYAGIPMDGIAIWHVIENPQVFNKVTPFPPTGVLGEWGRLGIRLIRANGGTPWDDTKALFNKKGTTISDLTSPARLLWLDGTPSGFGVKLLSDAGTEVQLEVTITCPY